jgi:tetratricopeptide (TPR) repeat protein
MIQQEIGDELGEGYTLHNTGLTFFYQSRWDRALKHLRRSLGIFDEFVGLPLGIVDQDDRALAHEGKALVLYTMGRVFTAMRQYDKAMDLLKHSLAIAQDIGDLAGEGRTKNRIGRVFLARGELDKALGYFQDSAAVSRESGHRRALTRALISMGDVMCLRGQYQEALDCCQQALAFYAESGDRMESCFVLVSIGRICLAQRECTQALNHFQHALDVALEIGNRYEQGVALDNLAKTYEKMGRGPEAESTREQAAAIFGQLGVSGQESIWH